MTTRSRESPPPIAQAAAVAYRGDSEAWEICLITSLNKGRWVLPKGIIEPGDTPAQTALKECLEEAGLHGRVVGPSLGQYEDFKWGTTLKVDVFLVEVGKVDADWPEGDVRRRDWFAPAEAIRRLNKPGPKKLLKKALKQLEKRSA